MASRLHVIASARQDQGTCRKCGQPINKGDAYVWFKHRYSGKYKYHNLPQCRPSAADRESNSKRAAWMQASDALNVAKGSEDPADAAAHLRDAMASVESCIEEIEDSLSNWQGTNFEYGDMAQNFEASRDELQSWLDDAESAASELESMELPYEPGDEPVDPLPEDYEQGELDPDFLTDQETYTQWETDNQAYEEALQSLSDTLDEIDDLPELQF